MEVISRELVLVFGHCKFVPSGRRLFALYCPVFDVSFMYLLPLVPCEASVELTVFFAPPFAFVLF